MKPELMLQVVGVGLSIATFTGVLITAWVKVNMRIASSEQTIATIVTQSIPDIKQVLAVINHELPEVKQSVAVLTSRMDGFDKLEARLYAAVEKLEDSAEDLIREASKYKATN